MTRVKYWSSSPRLVTAAGVAASHPHHVILMTVQEPKQPERTVQIANCISGVVSKRIAELLDRAEGL